MSVTVRWFLIIVSAVMVLSWVCPRQASPTLDTFPNQPAFVHVRAPVHPARPPALVWLSTDRLPLLLASTPIEAGPESGLLTYGFGNEVGKSAAEIALPIVARSSAGKSRRASQNRPVNNRRTTLPGIGRLRLADTAPDGQAWGQAQLMPVMNFNTRP